MADAPADRNALYQAQTILEDPSIVPVVSTRNAEPLQELERSRNAKNPQLLPDCPVAKYKLSTFNFILSYFDLGQPNEIVGGIQKFYCGQLSKGSIRLEHLKDSEAFYQFIKSEPAREYSDLADRLTYKGQRVVEN